MTGAIVATSIVFFPASPFFLFMKGKDITIPKGTEINAYINGDISLDPKKFAPPAQSNELAAPASPEAKTEQAPSTIDSEYSTVTIKSAPDGAEISIDGKFVGSTPSTTIDSEYSTVTIKPAPDGAEISIDGKFVGSTPSTLRPRLGEHRISMGYVLWGRTMTLSAGGNITVGGL